MKGGKERGFTYNRVSSLALTYHTSSFSPDMEHMLWDLCGSFRTIWTHISRGSVYARSSMLFLVVGNIMAGNVKGFCWGGRKITFTNQGKFVSNPYHGLTWYNDLLPPIRPHVHGHRRGCLESNTLSWVLLYILIRWRLDYKQGLHAINPRDPGYKFVMRVQEYLSCLRKEWESACTLREMVLAGQIGVIKCQKSIPNTSGQAYFMILQ